MEIFENDIWAKNQQMTLLERIKTRSNARAPMLVFLKQAIIFWSLNLNSNRNQIKSIEISFETGTINILHDHGTTRTQSDRAQSW